MTRPEVGPAPAGAGRDLHVACLCDVANFGDALFPLIAERRLRHRGLRVTGVTLTGRPSPWPDAPPSISLRTLVATAPPSAGVLIGGGNLVVGRPTSLNESALSGLWLGASWHAAVHDLPCLWNAPGLPRPFGGHALDALALAALAAADRVAVRDADSAAYVRPARPDVDLVPDTAAELAALWPAASLEPALRGLLDRLALPGDRPFVAIHLRDRGEEPGDLEAAAAAIEAAAARQDFTPLLLAIGPAVRDDEALRRLSARLSGPHRLVDAPASLKEIAAALAFARGYVGQSLHGYVAAAAYGVPGVLVAAPPARRLRGFLAHRGCPEALVPDWQDAFARLAELPARLPLPDRLLADLDGHWARTEAVLDAPRRPNPGAAAFLRRAAAEGAARLGADWALGPLRTQTYSTRRKPAAGSAPQTGAA